MKYLEVEITYKDDKKETFKCVDFPYLNGPFLELRLEKFETRSILLERISEVNRKFQ